MIQELTPTIYFGMGMGFVIAVFILFKFFYSLIDMRDRIEALEQRKK